MVFIPSLQAAPGAAYASGAHDLMPFVARIQSPRRRRTSVKNEHLH
jgi:hypothetical protein